MKIEEYVPLTTPSSNASVKVRIVGGPSKSSAPRVMTTVSEVMIERPAVWRIEWLTIAPNGSPECRTRFWSSAVLWSATTVPMQRSGARSVKR